MGPVPSAHGALRRRPARDDVGGPIRSPPASFRRRSQAKPCERDQAGTQSTVRDGGASVWRPTFATADSDIRVRPLAPDARITRAVEARGLTLVRPPSFR